MKRKDLNFPVAFPPGATMRLPDVHVLSVTTKYILLLLTSDVISVKYGY